jgi:hypothetical protein
VLENLVVSAWIGVRAGCDMTYVINSQEDIDFMLDDGKRRFEFAIETEALRTLLDVGSKALAEMEAIEIEEGAKQAAQELASQASGAHGQAAGRSV